MSANPDPDPAIATAIKNLDFRILALRWLWLGSIGLACLLLGLGIAFAVPNWNELDAAAPFGLGLVFLDGFQVMLVAIGATSGHRASSQAVRDMAAIMARSEAREAELEREAAERGRQIDALTAAVAKNTDQVAGVTALLAGGADQLSPRREHRG